MTCDAVTHRGLSRTPRAWDTLHPCGEDARGRDLRACPSCGAGLRLLSDHDEEDALQETAEARCEARQERIESQVGDWLGYREPYL